MWNLCYQNWLITVCFVLAQYLADLQSLVIDFVNCITSQLLTVLKNLIKIYYAEEKQFWFILFK